LRGGTIIFDSCCGRRAFFESAMQEIHSLIPERSPYRLSLDHPLYHSFFDITPEKLLYRPWARKAGAENGEPSCIGVDIGCRTAVFLFRWDVSCGWDLLEDSPTHHCLGYTTETARLLGTNLMGYITAENSAVMPLSKSMRFVDASEKKAGMFVIAQAKYHGLWRTRDAGLSLLLDTFHEKTGTPVRFATEAVALDSKQLFDTPFLYMTGHQAFTLTPEEQQHLQQYLLRGGILLAESCCGRPAFDRAFRREIKRALKGLELKPLPAGHPIYQFPNAIKGVLPRPSLARDLKISAQSQIPPRLEGISVNGNLAVIYSPYGLSCGWELAHCPYCLGINPTDAMALGVNILSYALMQ
jgi:hypothetical protein